MDGIRPLWGATSKYPWLCPASGIQGSAPTSTPIPLTLWSCAPVSTPISGEYLWQAMPPPMGLRLALPVSTFFSPPLCLSLFVAIIWLLSLSCPPITGVDIAGWGYGVLCLCSVLGLWWWRL